MTSVDREIAISTLIHERLLHAAVSSGTKQALEQEESAYYRRFNALAGTDIDPAKVREDMIKQKTARYEKILGCKLDSKEFQDRINATVDALNNRQTDSN